MLRRHLTGPRVGLVLAVGVGVVLGAVFAQPGSGYAASSVTKPVNTALPTITGTAAVGSRVTATRGTWTQKPTSYTYGWSRCDSDGACAGIVGATAKSYVVTTADVGHTLRVTVTAHNSAGSAAITSNPTTEVPPSGCPIGSGVIQVAQLAPPAQLVIAGASACTGGEALVEVTPAPRQDHGVRRPARARSGRPRNRDPVQPVRQRVRAHRR